MKKNENKLMYLMIAAASMRDSVSVEESKMICRYLNGQAN